MLLTNNTEAPQKVGENTVIGHVKCVKVITDISTETVPDVAMISTKNTKKKDSLLKNRRPAIRGRGVDERGRRCHESFRRSFQRFFL